MKNQPKHFLNKQFNCFLGQPGTVKLRVHKHTETSVGSCTSMKTDFLGWLSPNEKGPEEGSIRGGDGVPLLVGL